MRFGGWGCNQSCRSGGNIISLVVRPLAFIVIVVPFLFLQHVWMLTLKEEKPSSCAALLSADSSTTKRVVSLFVTSLSGLPVGGLRIIRLSGYPVSDLLPSPRQFCHH